MDAPEREKSYTLLDGKKTAEEIKKEIALDVRSIVQRGHRPPHLAAILVGHDGGSETYVGSKLRTCRELGFRSSLIRYEPDVTQEKLLEEIEKLNRDDEIDGFIVQLPLPKHIDEQKVIEAVAPEKDVDGFHPLNVGRMALGLPCFVSATPYGIVELLRRYGIETEGKHCVVLGRSNIVGRPVASLLQLKGNPGNATVTVCHSRTKDPESYTRSADILIVAMGIPHFVTKDMVKEGAVVIDVGTTRIPDDTRKSGYRLCGDVDFEEVAPLCRYITPVPGGVGPMTIVSLMRNTLRAAHLRIAQEEKKRREGRSSL